MIRMVCFDVGETLVDETREWGEWADLMGIPRLTFFAVLGVTIAQGRPHREVFTALRPGFDFARERAAREARGSSYRLAPGDFYPDTLPCLRDLIARGLRVGVVGNQPQSCEEELRRLGIPLTLVGSSERWGVAKPSPAFFVRLVQEADLLPGEIAYVGDRADNDVGPAADAGLVAVFLRRGPWAIVQEHSAQAARAHLRVGTLRELPHALASLGAGDRAAGDRG